MRPDSVLGSATRKITAVWMAVVAGMAGCGSARDSTPDEEHTDGARVVESATPRLVQDLRIGSIDGADHELFGEIVALAVGSGGDIYAFDRQAVALRWYRPDGTFVATIGRQGGGPGEYAGADGGLAVLTDGRVVLRDPLNGRLTVYSPDGTFSESWPSRARISTSTPLVAAFAGGVFNQVSRPPEEGDPNVVYVARFDSDHLAVDSVRIALSAPASPMVEVRNAAFQIRMAVPLSPGNHWALVPDGSYLRGEGSRYLIEWHRIDGTLTTIGRDVARVAVTLDERRALEQAFVSTLRRVDPTWDGDPLPIPNEKPYFRGIYHGRGGEVWVHLYEPGRVQSVSGESRPPIGDRPTEEEMRGLFPDPRDQPVVEPIAFDIFDEDGTYLGKVTAPDGFEISPRPVFGSEHVWAVTRDSLRVQYITRYRIEGLGR